MGLPKDFRTENLKLLGKGSQGIVYLLNEHTCIKVYHRPEFLPLELEVLLKARNEPFFPQVYEWGEDYMIREYIPGLGLKEYLRRYPLTPEISYQLAELFLAFERLGFRRLDTRFAHILVTPAGRIKTIDPANAMRKQSHYPKKFLSQLEKANCKKTFFRHLQEMYPLLYDRWK